MKTVYLHIGLHKTGSTAIQSAFAFLQRSNITYASLGHENHSIPIYTAFSETYQNYHIWKHRNESAAAVAERRRFYRAQLARALQANRHRNVIISGEDISALTVPALKALKEALSITHSKIQVVAYLREPVSCMRSALQENIKNGTNPRAPAPPSYRSCIERFRTVFGHDSVVLRIYDKASLLEGDVITDFAALVGVDAVPRSRHANVSLSTEAVRVLYRLNNQSDPSDPNRRPQWSRARFTEQLRQHFPGQFELPDQLIEGRVRHAELDWLLEATGIDFRTQHTTHSPSFDPEALAQYLARIEPGTFDTLRAVLRRQDQSTALPEDTDALLQHCATVLGRTRGSMRIRTMLSRAGLSRAGLSRLMLRWAKSGK